MPRTVYVTATAPRSGRSVVGLGLVELLAARMERVGVFRPVDAAPDELIELARARGHPVAHAVTAREARELTADELDKRVIAVFRELAAGCDAVVCEGTAGDLDLDARLASHLGCPVLAVVTGADATAALDAVHVAREALERRGCDVLGIIASRIPPGAVGQLAGLLAAEGGAPVYVLPESEELSRPTVREVAAALGARGDGDLDREVRDVRIAAMSAEHFLDEAAEGALVLVPGDRADILLACLAGPAPAGVVLTTGLAPSDSIRALLDRAPFPVLETEARTYDVAGAVQAVRPRLTTGRKAATALGVFQSAVDALELEERMALERPARMTPAMFEYELVERAKESRRHVVLAEGDDDRVLLAADLLLRRRAVDLTILGDPDAIRARAAELGADLHDARLVDPATAPRRETYARRYHELRGHKGVTEEMAHDVAADTSYFATLMVDAGDAEGMVSGAVHTTADTIRPAFEIIKARPGTAVVSSVFLMCLADRVLVYGDCAVNPEPSAEQLAGIAISSAETATAFGVEPRVAMLSYSTGASGKGAAVDATREATRLAQEQRPHMKIEGPIQYDAAIDAAVAEAKLPGSEVAGRATVFIFPDLATGNIAYKAVQRSAGAVAVGPVLQGLNKPVNDLSRGCTVPDIVNTVLITAIQAQEASGASTARLRVALPA